MSHRADVYNGRYERTKPFKSSEPNPLHPTFHLAMNATSNREMDRKSRRRKYKKVGDNVGQLRSSRSPEANRIKSIVKATALRQYINRTIYYFVITNKIKQPKIKAV